jgi:hypothetical protein
MRRPQWKRQLNNRGSALIVVIAILSLLALMGATAASAALVNVQMRGMSRLSDQNFYELEGIWDEIYELMGQDVSGNLKTAYAETLSKLYQHGYETNAAANSYMCQRFSELMMTEIGLESSSFWEDGTSIQGNETEKSAVCEKVEAYLNQYTEQMDQAVKDGLTISVSNVSLNMEKNSVSEGETETSAVTGISLKGLTLTYVNARNITSSITMDLEISAPNIRFIDGTNALSDYILIANGDINVKANSLASPTKLGLAGSLRGSNINICDNSRVTVDGANIIAQKNLNIGTGGGGGLLKIGTDTTDNDTEDIDDSAGTSQVWAENLVINGNNSSLESWSADFHIKDDLTIVNNQNTVSLNGGSYYGYGNEGSGGHQNSSAIIINGKNNRLNINLDSMMLAGHAYLKFANIDAASYKLAESVAQKNTQTMYLVPASDLTITVDGAAVTAANPMLLSSDQEKLTIAVKIDNTTYTYNDIPVSSLIGGSADSAGSLDHITAYTVSGTDSSSNSRLLLGVYQSRMYLFYDFDASSAPEADRRSFFETYLSEHVSDFNALLQNSGWISSEADLSGEKKDTVPGIFISTSDDNILTAGSVYKAADGTDDALYELVGNENSTSTQKMIQRISNLSTAFSNLNQYLTETAGSASERNFLPVGYYIDPAQVMAIDGGTVNRFYDGKMIVAPGNYTLDVSQQSEGLIIAGGKVKVTGRGTFRGLIISLGLKRSGGGYDRDISDVGAAAGIDISGNDITLIADSAVVQECISGSTADGGNAYLYDYGDNTASVLNDYPSFLKETNWKRGRSNGSTGSDDDVSGGQGEELSE